jgi:crossover junction endodeoxyribonuclease RuvC
MMTNANKESHRLTHLTAQNINLLHVRAYAPKEEFRCTGSDASESVSERVEADAQPDSRLAFLALDLGTTTGWALRAPAGQINHGFVSFKSQRFEGGGMRYLRFRRWLTELKATVAAPQGLGAVYFEEVRRHVGVDAAHVYGGLMATLTSWCEHHNIPYQGVPVGTIKKHVTGRGNASKDEVIAAMRALGHVVTDDNEADALALLHWAMDTQEL